MVLGLSTQVLEDTLFPEPLHMIPILNLTMIDRVMKTVCSVISKVPSQAGGEQLTWSWQRPRHR